MPQTNSDFLSIIFCWHTLVQFAPQGSLGLQSRWTRSPKKIFGASAASGVGVSKVQVEFISCRVGVSGVKFAVARAQEVKSSRVGVSEVKVATTRQNSSRVGCRVELSGLEFILKLE